jgi:hypothetical protein
VQRRTLSEALQQYPVHHAALIGANTEAAAYWLGFLLADGHIASGGRSCKSKQLRIVLQARDVEHVETLRVFIGGSPVRTKMWRGGAKMYPSALLLVSNTQLCQSLEAMGWSEFKQQGCTRILDSVSAANRPHLIRGMIDGDGWVGSYRNAARIGFCDKHRDIVDWVANVIAAHLRKKPHRLWKATTGNCFTVTYRGDTAVAVLRWLYAECTVAMPRKQSIASVHLLK